MAFYYSMCSAAYPFRVAEQAGYTTPKETGKLPCESSSTPVRAASQDQHRRRDRRALRRPGLANHRAQYRPAHSLADSFDLPLGAEPVEIAPRLWGKRPTSFIICSSTGAPFRSGSTHCSLGAASTTWFRKRSPSSQGWRSWPACCGSTSTIAVATTTSSSLTVPRPPKRCAS